MNERKAVRYQVAGKVADEVCGQVWRMVDVHVRNQVKEDLNG